MILSNSRCTDLLKPQTVHNPTASVPISTSTVTLSQSEENTLQPSPVSTIQPMEIVQKMLEQVNEERILKDIRQLTGIEPICVDKECYTVKNRYTGSKGLRWAKAYLYKELASMGYSVEYQDWSLSGYVDQNLIARKVGVLHPNEEIYFVAHIDGVKKIWANRFPAADDNASGIVDLLEVARILNSYSFDRTLVFFFSTGEEEGTLGVKSYLQGVSQKELSAIKYVINIDMVGYDDDRDGVMELWYGDDPSSFVLTQKMNETILAYQLDLSPEFVVGCG